MVRIAIPGGSTTEILAFVNEAKKAHQLDFDVFDDHENVDEKKTWTYHQTKDQAEAISQAVSFVAEGHAQVLMKGLVQTHSLLKEVLKDKHHLHDRRLLSHVAMIQFPDQKQLLLTDAGMNINPSVETAHLIVKNVVHVAQKMGILHPKVAMLSAAENFNPLMPSSVLAREVTDVFQGEPDFTVFGPLSLDLALSKESVARKQFNCKIAGDADILVVPNIDVGNVFYKALLLFTDATLGGIIAGAKVPIIATSRSDKMSSNIAALEFALSQL